MENKDIKMTPDFEKMELIPAIIQDASTKTVLMLGYMNDDAFKKTQDEKRVTFFSRSKKRLWTKGETSGNFLNVESIKIDCDNDTILIFVNPVGPACHNGTDTCFGSHKNEALESSFLNELESVIQDRRDNPSEKSYTTSLFNEGLNKIAQKVGEEGVEIVIAALAETDERLKEESADFFYHLLVLFAEKRLSINDAIQVLKKRHR
jgi:phosphoribosyl-ATP pyrophosphohydrolase/phosphoribosyl-AMP cyclohydrolase